MSKDKLLRLVKYAEGLQRRLEGDLSVELRKVIEIDLKKTTTKIESLRLSK